MIKIFLQERLGVILEKEDEMDCAVSGCNFLLNAVQNEAFSFENGQADFTSAGLVPIPTLPKTSCSKF